MVDGVPAHGMRVGTIWSLGFLPTQTDLCFYKLYQCKVKINNVTFKSRFYILWFSFIEPRVHS